MESSDGGDDQASGWMQVKKVCFLHVPFCLEFELIVFSFVMDGN